MEEEDDRIIPYDEMPIEEDNDDQYRIVEEWEDKFEYFTKYADGLIVVDRKGVKNVVGVD
jgi:hypothetical protein